MSAADVVAREGKHPPVPDLPQDDSRKDSGDDVVLLATPTERSGRANAVRIAVLAASVYFAFANRGMLGRTAAGAGQTALVPTMAGGLLSLVAVANRGQMHRSAHAAAGLTVPSMAMTRTAAIGFAANKILKSAGVSGLAVFVRDGRRRGLASGSVAAAYLLAELSSSATFGLLLMGAISILAAQGRLVGWWLAAALGFGVYVIGALILGLLAVHGKRRVQSVWSRAQAAYRQRLRRPVDTASASTSTIDALYAAVDGARHRQRWTRRLVSHALASKGLGILMLLAACHASGVRISAAEAVVIYSAALAASFVSLVPAGLGVVEASTGAMLVSAGASVPAAALGVVLFRIFDLWIPIVAGTVLAHHAHRSTVEGVASHRADQPSTIAPDAVRTAA